MSKARKGNNIVKYSPKIEGEWGNYNWPVDFSIIDGFVTIWQYEQDQTFKEAVLLSPLQVRKLFVFVKRHGGVKP